jgi:hypothetical protein
VLGGLEGGRAVVVTRGGRAAKAAVGMASARAAPLFGPGG